MVKTMVKMKKVYKKMHDVAIIGGLGHVGLPLGISFANENLKVCLYDLDKNKAGEVRKGKMPFIEYGAEPILKKVLKNGTLEISLDIKSISKARHVIIAIGTPVDEYLSPKIRPFLELFTKLSPYLSKDQIIIIRSTVYPRTCKQILNYLDKSKGPWHVAYCPERIIQGHSIKELKELPQLVAGLTLKAREDACKLFAHLSPKILPVSVEEAELAKLFTNAWRYLQFAVANQFYMICHQFDVDFSRIRKVMMESYGRAGSLPSAGFAAGPCLLKDTMQLVSSCNNEFFLGHAAMMVNEGLPNFLVQVIKENYDLNNKKVGILGMAFKADIDDTRDSLSFKLVKILQFNGAKVICSDEFAEGKNFVSKEQLIKESHLIIIGVPHSNYKGIKIPSNKKVVDLWGVVNKN